MLPITRANLHSFCRICLRELLMMPHKPNHDVEKENITELLQNIAGVSTKHSHMCPQKICHSCYIKMIALDTFRQKYVVRIGVLKLTVMEDLDEAALHRLKAFCRVCLRSASDIIKVEENQELLYGLEKCSGLQPVAKEGAEGESLLADDSRFPRTLCSKCISKLKTLVAFRKLAEQSEMYMKSLIHDGESAIEVKNGTNDDGNMEKEKQYLLTSSNDETPDEDKEDYLVKHQASLQLDTQRKLEVNTESFKGEIETLNLIDEPLMSTFEVLKFEENPLDDPLCKEQDLPWADSDSDCTSEEIVENNNNMQAKDEKNEEKSSKSEEPVLKKGPHKRRSTKYIYCSKCDKPFFKFLMLEAHIKEVHEGVDRPFVCDFPNCSSSFRQHSNLDRHKTLLHYPKKAMPKEVDVFALPKPNVHVCMTCLRQFKRRDVLDQHINSAHTETALKPFKCQFCQKGFGSKRTMLRHEKNHSSERPFICEFCPKRYNTKVQLSSHMERHTTKPELLCPICKRGKANAEELQKHIAMHEASRQHQCPKCGRVFTKLFHLRDHDSAVHLKLRPFKCSHCPKTFATRRTQKEHEELHDPTSRPVFCALCTMNFKNETSFLRHMTREHNQPSKKSKTWKNRKTEDETKS